MPQKTWSAKRERQYEHIKDSEREQGRSEDRAEEIAPRPSTSSAAKPVKPRRSGRAIANRARSTCVRNDSRRAPSTRATAVPAGFQHHPIWERTEGYAMNLIAWVVLGAIAGYLAGFLVKGDEGLGIIGHIALGIVGALVGGFLAGVLFNVKDPIQGPIDLSTIVISVIGAIIVVVVVGMLTGSRRVGSGRV